MMEIGKGKALIAIRLLEVIENILGSSSKVVLGGIW